MKSSNFRKLGYYDGSDPAALGATEAVQQGLDKADQKVREAVKVMFFYQMFQVPKLMFHIVSGAQSQTGKSSPRLPLPLP